MLEIQSLTVGYGNGPVVQGVSLDVNPGQVVALVGPNGSGKTTLMRATSGVIPFQGGSIRLKGVDTRRMSPSERAQGLAVVPQARQLPAGFTVWETVLLGRTPYLGWLGKTGRGDEEQVRRALELTDTLELAERPIDRLSGGEQQRVLLARALAQEAQVLLLDEPEAHLDLHYQAELLEMIYKLSREKSKAILMALHDLNLAALYSDRVALLVQGRLKAAGKPEEVLTLPNLTGAFRTPLHVMRHPDLGVPVILPDGHN